PTEKRWRRGWDSNPRYSCPYTAFPVPHLRPLGHPSASLSGTPEGAIKLAEGRGFEPPRDLRPYPISSRTPSTGLGHPSASSRSSTFKEPSQQRGALVGEHATGRGRTMIQPRVVEQSVQRGHGARLWIVRTIHHARDARVQRGAATHRARLDRRVER